MKRKAKSPLDDIIYDGGGKKEEPSMMETLTNKFGSMFEGMDFTSKMKKANSLIPIVKMIPGGEEFLKDQAYRIGSISSSPFRKESDLNKRDSLGNVIGGKFKGGVNNRDLLKLALYNDETNFQMVPEDILKKATIPLSNKKLNEKYEDLDSYYSSNKFFGSLSNITPVTDSIPYNNIRRVVGDVINKNRVKKGLPKYFDDKLLPKADSVLNSITTTNSVIYSDSGADNGNNVRLPYQQNDNLAGYVARIRRDPETNALWYDQNDVWDFDEDYGNRWGGGSRTQETTEQAKALSSVTKPFRLISTNPITKPKRKYKNGGNLYFLGGLTGATAMSGGADIAGKVSDIIPTTTKGGGAASGALKGASMGSALGPYGMAAGAVIGGVAGFIGAENAQNKQAFSNSINSMKERNQMLGIKANGGYIVPLGVSPNMTSQYEGGGMLTEFNNGGTHEESPYQGIPQGVAPDGQANKVEEGETKWQDYIFSDRLLLDKNTVEQHNLPKSMIGKTFAEASKKMSKLYKERPNDPISRNTQKDYMQHLMMANDESRAFEESSLMSGGGHLLRGGGTGRTYYDANSNELLASRSGNTFFKPGLQQPINTGLEISKLIKKAADIKSQNEPKDSFFKDPKNLRYAPIAFDALAATGLFGKSPMPGQYSPTLIQQQGSLTPAQIDEMQMQNAVDSAYQTGAAGLAEASGGSGAALRANLSGLNADYMSGVGKSYIDVNKANNAAKMTADQFNLGMSANTASQNAQAMNQAGMYNNQMLNAVKSKRYEDYMSYLGKGAEGLGDIGYEQRMSEIMPKIYGYDQYGNYMPSLNKKACGGRIRLKNNNK